MQNGKELAVNRNYDAIVVGARCAGSPTAMLLARKGYRVLLVDRARFPSDTVSTHIVQPLAAAALQRWGLLEALDATGCPPVHTYSYDFGPIRIEGAPGTADAPVAYCPRRTILDKLLVDAAVEAGAEFREGFIVDEVTIENGKVDWYHRPHVSRQQRQRARRGRRRCRRLALDRGRGRTTAAL